MDEKLDRQAKNSPTDVAPFVAKYDVDTNALPLSGDGIRSLKHLGEGRFRMEQVAKSFLLTRREISEFELHNCQITPKSYRAEQSGIGRDRRSILDFSNDKSKVTFESKKQQQVIELPQNKTVYDRLNETLALQCMLIDRGRTDTLDQPMNFTVVDKGNLREHTFAVTNTEVLTIAKTEMQVLRVERVRDNDNRQTILWFAPEHNYALVKMEQDTKGKKITFTLKSIEQVF